MQTHTIGFGNKFTEVQVLNRANNRADIQDTICGKDEGLGQTGNWFQETNVQTEF